MSKRCPKCGADMYEGSMAFYCPRVGCNGVVKKEEADLPRNGDKKGESKPKKRTKKTYERKTTKTAKD